MEIALDFTGLPLEVRVRRVQIPLNSIYRNSDEMLKHAEAEALVTIEKLEHSSSLQSDAVAAVRARAERNVRAYLQDCLARTIVDYGDDAVREAKKILGR